MIKAIAIDDEPMALNIIRNHAEQTPIVDLAATFLSAAEALTYIRSNPVQLIFLDINMPDLSGLEFATLVNQRAQIVFTTAHPEHAIKGFELAATDYLLKPINFGRFLQACELAEKRLSAPAQQSVVNDNSLFVKDGYDWVRINIDNLLCAEAEGNYVTIFEGQKSTLTRTTLSKLLLKLPKDEFVQVHKSFVVAVSKVEKVEKHQLTVAGKKIPVSNSYRDAFLQILNKI
jgi:two-component system, LytTR family, response regulator